MNTRSTIMDTNSFRAEHADALDTETRKLTEKRSKILGDSYRLFYRNPVHLVRGEGQYLWDAAGNQYLDVYNNVARAVFIVKKPILPKPWSSKPNKALFWQIRANSGLSVVCVMHKVTRFRC